MKKFEDLPENVRVLLLAKLAMELKTHRCTDIIELSEQHHTDVPGVWRQICRLAKQPTCTVPEAGIRH
jgi:hypothetical protein